MEEDRAAQPLMHTASDDFTESNRERGGAAYALEEWLVHNHWRRSRDQHSKV